MPGAWQGSDRRATLPPGWPRIRRRILMRDGHRCRWITDGRRCGAAASDVDHIGDRDDHSDGNLRSLCGPHHLQRTSAQANAARWAKGSSRRPVERHPGLR